MVTHLLKLPELLPLVSFRMLYELEPQGCRGRSTVNFLVVMAAHTTRFIGIMAMTADVTHGALFTKDDMMIIYAVKKQRTGPVPQSLNETDAKHLLQILLSD